MYPPPIFFKSLKKINCVPLKKYLYIYIYLDPPQLFFGTLSFFSLHGNGDTICISRKIQCLLYAGFFLWLFRFFQIFWDFGNCLEIMRFFGLKKCLFFLQNYSGTICHCDGRTNIALFLGDFVSHLSSLWQQVINIRRILVLSRSGITNVQFY